MTPPLDPGTAYRRIAENVQLIIQGKPDVVRLAIVALFAEGHILIEDVPGLGKTSLAHSLARSIGGSFNRIQFTPDLLPGDVTGSMIYHQADGRLEFRPGAVFTHVLLADEINRGTPKTQSALLEVMAEGRVTVDATSHEVPKPFLVVATQNPIELEGTYRLPEAQLDRFLVRLAVDYPDHDAEVQVVMRDAAGASPAQLQPVIDMPTLHGVLATVRQTFVDPQVASYAVRLAAATRDHRATRYGASPRGSIGLVRAGRALAATDSRAFVTPDDIKTVATAVLAHRIVLTPDAELNRYTSAQVVTEVLEAVPAPGLLPNNMSDGGPEPCRHPPVRGPRPTRRGIAVAVAGVALLAAGLMIGIPVLRGLGGFALGALAVALVPSSVRLRPGATRTLHPVRLERGQRATARLVLSNDRGQRQPAFTALDRLDGEVVRIAVPALPRGGRSEHAYDVPTTRRGLLQVGPLTVERTDPLGLARFRTDLGELASLWVYPRRIPVRVATSGRLRHHHEGMVTDRPLRGTADLRSLREYIPGDELRHVHARASARTGTLVVRELVDPVQPHCTIVLDNRPSALSPDAFEEAVEIAASIAWSAVADGCRVVLRTAEGDSWRAAERPETMQPVLDRLASIGQVAAADLSRTLSLTGQHGQGGWLVVVTGAADRDVLASLTGMRGFSPITIFDVSGWPESATAPGVAILRGGTATDVITQWNRTVAP